jgi:hypothetical protein
VRVCVHHAMQNAPSVVCVCICVYMCVFVCARVCACGYVCLLRVCASALLRKRAYKPIHRNMLSLCKCVCANVHNYAHVYELDFCTGTCVLLRGA